MGYNERLRGQWGRSKRALDLHQEPSSQVDGDGLRGASRQQSAARFRLNLKRLEWKTGRKMKIAYLGAIRLCPLQVNGRKCFYRLMGVTTDWSWARSKGFMGTGKDLGDPGSTLKGQIPRD